MVFCGGTYRGSVLRFTVTNGYGRDVEPVRLDAERPAMAGEGAVTATTTFEPGVVFADGDTVVACGRALPAAFRLLSDPPMVPVDVRFVHRVSGEDVERTKMVWVEVVMDYRAEACADLPRDLCRPAP